jgi:hypothetical protein
MKLPDIITLNEYGGDFNSYIEAVYEIFKRDFVDSRPSFNGIKLRLKKHPITDGRECTFYHLTHEGHDEQNREPDMRRMERLCFIKPMIENPNCADLRIWRNKRGNNERILIFHEYESFLVILDDRGEYILPWTAYYIQHNSRKQRLIAEYEAYIKTKTAQGH